MWLTTSFLKHIFYMLPFINRNEIISKGNIFYLCFLISFHQTNKKKVFNYVSLIWNNGLMAHLVYGVIYSKIFWNNVYKIQDFCFIVFCLLIFLQSKYIGNFGSPVLFLFFPFLPSWLLNLSLFLVIFLSSCLFLFHPFFLLFFVCLFFVCFYYLFLYIPYYPYSVLI